MLYKSMIIQCVNCFKKFEVNSALIPDNGRTIQCGLCNHTWFYKSSAIIPPSKVSKEIKIDDKKDLSEEYIDFTDIKKKKKDKTKEIKKSSNFGLGKLLSYLIVFIISFIAIIIILETFKTPLGNIYPGLEFLLYSLFETIKDIVLFFKNLLI